MMNAAAHIDPNVERGGTLRCLWIGRYIPFPMNEGAKVYSAKLAGSLASAGCFVRVLGFGNAASAPRSEGSEWVGVPGTRGRDIGGIVNRLPLAAAVDATNAYRSLLDRQLREHWDVIVFDSYASGWALDRCKQYRAGRGTQSVFVHVSHNDEAAVWKSLAERMSGSTLRRWLIRRNAQKVAQLEQRLVSEIDLLCAITEEDAVSLMGSSNAARSIALTPGYDGPIAPRRTITSATPRRVVVVGSFNWVVKRENLRQFVEHADPIFAREGIELVIAGTMPDELSQLIQAQCRATRTIGFVHDLVPLLAESRIALVPELIGGGFKLKLLDYLFGRVPIATVDAAAAGLPEQIRACLIAANDFPGLVAHVVQRIDDVEELNRRQQTAFEHAQSAFRWEDRGARLLARIVELRNERAATRERRFGS